MVAQKPLNFSQAVYGNHTKFYVGDWGNSTSPELDALISDPGPGLRCVNNVTLKSMSGHEMNCIPGDAEGTIDFHKEWSVSYNVSQTCGCSDAGGWNCTSADYPVKDLQRMRFNTTDELYSLTGRNISQFRMITFDNTTERKEPILGGWTFNHVNLHGKTPGDLVYIRKGFQQIWQVFNETTDLFKFDWQSVVDNSTLITNNDTFLPDDPTILESFEFMFGYMDIPDAVKVWYNNKNWLSLPINVNLFYNAALRSRLPAGKSPADYGILPISHPMNDTVEDILNSMAIQKTGTFRIVLMTLAICVIAASFSMFLVDEHSSKSFHLQKVFGISPWLYHCVNLIYDFTFYFACILLIIFTYWSVGTTLFTFSLEAFTSSIIVFVFYGFCILPFIYICQMFFTVPSMAFAIISIGLFLFGVTSTTTVMLLENLQTDDEGLETASRVCSVIFLIIPPYNLGMAINRLSFIHNLRIFGAKFLENIGRPDLIDKLPLPVLSEWELMGKHIVCLFLSAIFYTLLLLIIEYRNVLFKFLRVFERKNTARLYSQVDEKHMDEDVKTEQDFVEKMDDFEGYGLVVKKLCKSYNKENLAVKGISFTVANGEVFGLLGVNGAGKTTTFSMLTGSLAIGQGDVIVCGSSIVKDNFLSLRDIGYCPQFDALNLKLTAREHLVFYARIRGVSEIDIDDTVDWALSQMKLKPYADEIAESYSGGNKRKLSAAIALISDPPVVLLDEPSAGMDPSSQQFMWHLILQLRRSNRTVIITSHSMEECEALCSKTAIMVEGQFRCLGSIQHLKERWIQVGRLKQVVEEVLPEAKLVSLHLSTFFYRIKGTSSILPVLFKRIAELRAMVSIEDFSISQTSLDDVFISFAMASNPEETLADLDAKVSVAALENGNGNAAVNGRSKSAPQHIRSISEAGPFENTAL
ncbi:ATP-binding cassette sub-family A member 1 [Aphelenchoides bicaudatus]|nr:ATP-binding cassette sub-family A member 1 [Aphelenchoides bicaudatus]